MCRRSKRKLRLGRWESVAFVNGRKDGMTLANGLRILARLRLMRAWYRRDWERYCATFR